MGGIIKPGDPPPSCSTQLESRKEMADIAEIARSIVHEFTHTSAWDQMQAKDVPAEILNFVAQRQEEGIDLPEIRRELGIARSTDRSWRKINAAIMQGQRIDRPMLLQHIAYKWAKMSKKVEKLIDDAILNGVQVPTADGVVTVKGASKELAGIIDTWLRGQATFVKIGKDLGAFVDTEGKGGGNAGVTIVVQNNVRLASREKIEEHRAQEKERNDILIAQSMTLPDSGKPVGNG